MDYVPYTIEDVKESSSRELFTVVSTFAGGGGSSTGYRLAGAKVIAINEFVEEAIETYSTNFPDTKIIPGDIKDYTGEDFLREANLKVGELDILDGSPPCSAFSIAGKGSKGWKGAVKDTRESYFDMETGEVCFSGELCEANDGKKTYSDGKKVEAIEDLFLEFIRIAKDIQPKVIIAENVRGLMFGDNKAKLIEFLNAFEDIGYIATAKMISAADYGVSQTRERTIFVCVREDVADEVGLNFMNIDTVYPTPNTRYNSSTKRMEPDLVPLKSALENVAPGPADENQELFDYVQNGFQKKWVEDERFLHNPKRTIKVSEFHPKASLFNMIRPSLELPCPTLTQRGQQKSVSGVFHPLLNRKFNIPELMRVMGLPDNYKLTGSFDQKAERIGRMVAPKMMAAIASSVYEKVIKVYNEKNDS